MPSLMFPNFLADATEYDRAVKFWQQKWAELIAKTGQAGRWRTPWIANEDQDGNPIFSAIDETRRLGVRIIQEERTAPDDVDLDWWFDSFGEETDPQAIPELVIACILSDQIVGDVTKVLADWITHGQVTLPDEGGLTWVAVPTELVPAVRELIARETSA